jgi:hypothetical protein
MLTFAKMCATMEMVTWKTRHDDVRSPVLDLNGQGLGFIG